VTAIDAGKEWMKYVKRTSIQQMKKVRWHIEIGGFIPTRKWASKEKIAISLRVTLDLDVSEIRSIGWNGDNEERSKKLEIQILVTSAGTEAKQETTSRAPQNEFTMKTLQAIQFGQRRSQWDEIPAVYWQSRTKVLRLELEGLGRRGIRNLRLGADGGVGITHENMMSRTNKKDDWKRVKTNGNASR
jgi:hypothetical protein